jgi:intracellular multiplication protein IcmQ
MASEDELKRINKILKSLLQELLQTGNWEASLFLRTTYKKLAALYEKADSLSKQLESDQKLLNKDAWKEEQGYIKVYVSLYQSDPYNLQKWQNTLKNIREYSVNRPIYLAEEHVQEMIRSKQASPNEGYVIIYIKKNDIIPAYAGKMVEDKWGHELLTLRDNSLSPNNIIEFVHQGRRYSFQEGELLLKISNK